MDNFKFINETIDKSGRITSCQTRKTIRAYASRHHWKNTLPQHLGCQDQKPKTPNSIKRPSESKSGVNKAVTAKSSLDTEKASCLEDHHQQHQCIHDHGPLAALDVFPQIGTHNDTLARRFFNHYLVEFRVMLCDHIQPVTPVEQSLCARTAIQEGSPTLFHAICFTSAAHEALTSSEILTPRRLFQREIYGSRLQNSAIQHKVAAISSLNTELAMPSDPIVTTSMILSVTVLLMAEIVLGDDPKAITAHLDGLGRMVSVFGGESCLPPRVKAQIRMVDIKTALILQSRPRFDLYTNLSQRLDSCPGLRSPPSAPGSPYHFFPCFTKISPDLRRCVDYTNSLIRVMELEEQGLENYSKPLLDDFITLESAILSSNVVSDSGDLDDLVRLALLLYCNTSLWKIPLYFNWIIALRAQLMSSLLIAEQRSQHSYYDGFLLWAILLGRYTAAPGSEAEKIMWNLNLKRVSLRLALRRWSDAEVIVGGFLSSGRLYGHAWKGIWENAVLGSSQRYLHRFPKHPCVFNSPIASNKEIPAYSVIDTAR